jgi:hypothetical protein
MFKTFEHTSQLITVLDLQKEPPYDFHYPVIMQITQTVMAMTETVDSRLPVLLLNEGMLEKWTESLVVLLSATRNMYTDDALYHMILLFVEFAGNSLFIDQLISTPLLIDTIFRSMILSPKRVYSSSRIQPELTAFLMNLANADDMVTLVEKGLVQCCLTQLLRYYHQSTIITHYCLDTLETLMIGVPDEVLSANIVA